MFAGRFAKDAGDPTKGIIRLAATAARSLPAGAQAALLWVYVRIATPFGDITDPVRVKWAG